MIAKMIDNRCMNQPPLLIQILSLIGAFFCLIAYVGHQLKWMDSSKLAYNLLNAMGSGILAYLAFKPFQAGFLMMETVWALISIYALYRLLKTD